MHLFKFFFFLLSTSIFDHVMTCIHFEVESITSTLHCDALCDILLFLLRVDCLLFLRHLHLHITIEWIAVSFGNTYNFIFIFLFLSQDHVYSITLILPPLNVRLLSHFAIICSNATQNPAPTDGCLGVGFHQITE